MLACVHMHLCVCVCVCVCVFGQGVKNKGLLSFNDGEGEEEG